MESGVLLGIDHGGSTTTALVLDPESGSMTARSVAMPKSMPRDGWVEHDPEDFLRTSLDAARAALDAAGLTWRDVRAVGLANQGETSMAWQSGDGGAVGPALSWEDRRTSALCDSLAERGVDILVRERTGVLLDPYFSASKFRWLLDNVTSAAALAEEGRLRVGGTDSFVIDRLTGGAVHATDAATGSRTALLNLRRGAWDPDLMTAFGLDPGLMPEIRPTAGDFGTIRSSFTGGGKVAITADAVDAHAAMFAQGCRRPGVVKATYGTGAFIEVNTGAEPVEPDGLLPVFIAWDIDGRMEYTLEGAVFAVGSAIDWMVNTGFFASAEATGDLAASVPDSGGVAMVPSFTGLSAPHWKPAARAGLVGMGLATTPGHIARALLDGIAFQCAEIIAAIGQRQKGALQEVRADGGPTRNSYLMQRQADVMGLPVLVSQEADMTALGAALLAGIGAGQLFESDMERFAPQMRCFEPRIGADERQAAWAFWHRAVETLGGWEA
jgi:glycerol kinase